MLKRAYPPIYVQARLRPNPFNRCPFKARLNQTHLETIYVKPI